MLSPSSKRPTSRRSGNIGFTLVEMLVAFSVLSLLAVLVFTILQGASSTIQAGDRRQEATSQARLALGRLAADIASQVRREDIAYGYEPPGAPGDYPGNDELAFYTEATSHDGDRNTALVQYRANPATGELERGVAGLTWDGDAPVFLDPSEWGEIHNLLPPMPAANFQPLAPQVLRFEVCFLAADEATGEVRLASHPPRRTGDLRALVVGLAILDSQSRAKVSADGIRRLAARLPDPADDQDPVTAWEEALRDSAFATGAGVSPQVASEVRLYQRYFPIP